MTSEFIKHVDDKSFENDVLKSSLPVLIDFWAPWCGPCKAIAPAIEAIAQENAGRLLVCKVNVDESPETAARFGIRGIPTVILFKNGGVAKQVVGAVPKSQIDEMITSVL